MKKSDKIIVFFYIFLAISYFTYVVISSENMENNPFHSVTPKKITDFTTNQLIDVKKEIIFNEMTNIEYFPNVLPQNVINVIILNKTDNVIIAEETLSEAGINITLLVKHTINPYNEHIIEILDGDAKGTTIIQSFEEIDAQTNLNTTVHLEVKGILSLIAYLPESNFIHAIHTVNSHFANYTKLDIYEKKVNLLYVEILNRPADIEGLTYFSGLLRTSQITEDGLRFTLLNSEEALNQLKSIEELNNETKNVIDDLYQKILLRSADPEGMKYFGNLLETGTTTDEIRTTLLESEEGKNVSSQHPIRNEIKLIFRTLFDIPQENYVSIPDEYILNYYHKMIDDTLMNMDDIKKELEEFGEYPDIKNN
jgi:hypothetical protein